MEVIWLRCRNTIVEWSNHPVQLWSSQNTHVMSHSASDRFYTLFMHSHVQVHSYYHELMSKKGYSHQRLHPRISKEWPSHQKRLAHNHALQILGNGAKYWKSTGMLVWQSWGTTDQFVCSSCTTPEWETLTVYAYLTSSWNQSFSTWSCVPGQ